MKNFFSRFRRNPGLPINDAWTLYWWTTIAEILVAGAATLAALKYSPFRLAGLEVLAILFVALHLFGSTYGAIYYPDKHTLETQRKMYKTETKSLFRRGEVLNAVFTSYIGFLIPLLAAWGILATSVPSSAFMVAETSVGILVSFSIVKMIRVPSEQRRPHNEVLFWLAMTATATATLLLFGEAFLGKLPVDSGVLDLYTVIVVSYAAHNTAFSLLCPQFNTRRPGHLVGFIFVLGIMAIAALYTIGVIDVLPDTLAQFGIRTGAIMVLGLVLSYYFRSPAKDWREKKAAIDSEKSVTADTSDETDGTI